MCIRDRHSGSTVLDQTVGTTFGNAVLHQMVGTISGYAVFDQSVRAISGHTIFDQTIRTPFSHTAFNQTIRAAFSDHRLSRGSGKSVNCKDRESDAEEGLAFHDGVLRGVVGWYGADVTPRNFYENFIDVMVNIDGIDRRCESHHAGVMVQSTEGADRAGRRFYTGSVTSR